MSAETQNAPDEFIEAYCEALIWSSGEEFDGAECSIELLEQMEKDCNEFWSAASRHIPDDRHGDAGHDFALTRGGHGAGFWDGDWPDKIDEELTVIASGFGVTDIYIGDNGQIFGM